jgi:hypothetical protein
MASTYLQRTLGTPTSSRIWTFSAWIKRTILYSTQHIFSLDNGSQRDAFSFDSDDGLRLYFNGSATGYADLSTNRVFQDTSAWYHLVLAVDTTQGTAADRVKLYINGTQYTWDETTVYGDQNYDTFNASGNTFRIGRDRTAANYFDGLMSHVHFCDGTQLAPTVFGSTDSTTGEWKINTSPSFTPGNNGFTVLKDGNTITDQSANSNDFSLGGGTLSSTVDCPSNVYSTWNYLSRSAASGIQNGGWGHGATYIATETAANHRSFGTTLAFPGTGKFYAEFKIGNLGSFIAIGIMEAEAANKILSQTDTGSFSNSSVGYSYRNNGYKENGGVTATYGNTYTSYDYIGVAYNNGALWFSKNGTWQNSATISEIAAGTTTNAAFTGISTTEDYHFMFRGNNDSMIELNAGNGWFRTTEVGSPNNPSSGDTAAKFKYAVPTAFQPLSTKGLNS